VAGLLGKRGFVGRGSRALLPQRNRIPQHLQRERLRCLCEVYRIARQRARDDSHPWRRGGFLHRVDGLDSGNRRPASRRRVDHACEQLSRCEGPRRVMDDDHLREAGNLRECARHRILAAPPAIDDANRLCRRHEIWRRGGREVRRKSNHDLADEVVSFDHVKAALQDRPVTNEHHLLRHRRAETRATASCGDDRGHEHAGDYTVVGISD
jgi:hypothetical protein